jgi:dihydropteroate synthase
MLCPILFSDAGQFNPEALACLQAEAFVASGVERIDIGGESNRPYAAVVSEQDEL